jgi:mono/diheme cytochrome c family protein
LIVVIAALVAACSVGRPAPDASGEEIYALLCANCHGEDLSGGLGPSLGPGSNTASQSDEFLSTTIVRGRGRMPSFSSSLDDLQLDRLIEYIREVEEK